MLTQLEWDVQNEPITKNKVLPVTTLIFENFVSVSEPLTKIWFDVPTTQMTIFILFVSAVVLLERAFTPWVSLKSDSHLPKKLFLFASMKAL